jgi:hypothetical protein
VWKGEEQGQDQSCARQRQAWRSAAQDKIVSQVEITTAPEAARLLISHYAGVSELSNLPRD